MICLSVSSILKRMLYAVTGAEDFHDGFLLTTMVKVSTTEKSVPAVAEKCTWIPVINPELNKKLIDMYNESEGCNSIPFMFYR